MGFMAREIALAENFYQRAVFIGHFALILLKTVIDLVEERHEPTMILTDDGMARRERRWKFDGLHGYG